MNTLNNHNGAVRENDADDATSHGAAYLPLAQFARTQNYWLGGKDNGAIDREVGKHVAELSPSIHTQARAGQLFSRRAVRYLASVRHIRQFIHVGIEFPSDDNTHDVAQRVAPNCKIVYVDHDAVLLAHARALLTSHPDGACDYVDADLREADKILAGVGQTLDFCEPMALLLLGALRHLSDDDEATSVVARLTNALTPGSFVAISHPTNMIHGQASSEAWRYWNKHGTPQVVLRSAAQIAVFFHGLQLLEPGVVSCSGWRPEPEPDPWAPRAEVDEFCGVARKPGSPQ